MAYLVHTAHLQFAGLLLGFVSWILTAVSMGLVQWRVWHVADITNITSGVAWVGIWRACFPSRALVSSELQVLYCRSIPFRDPSTPTEVSVAQVLVPVALMLSGGGNACAVYGLRRVYFGMERMKLLRVAFSVAGALSLLSGVCTMLPLAWNMRSVAANYTIDFPPDFHMPPSPVRQDVGAGLSLGMLASILTILSALTFIFYRLPKAVPHRQNSGAESAPNQSSHSNHEWAAMCSHGNNTQVATANPGRGSQTDATQGDGNVKSPGHARENPAFEDT